MKNRAFLPIVAALAIAVTACGGDKPAATSDSNSNVSQSADSSPPVAALSTTDAAEGEALYGRCIACHQANGAGVPGAFPPLAESEWVNGPAARPIAILLHGVQGEMNVRGVKYNSMMMAFGTAEPMTDTQVASVLTYVRSSFGNNAPPVSAEDVAKVRAATAGRSTPMTEQELLALQ